MRRWSFPEPARSHRRCASQAGHLRRVPPWTPSISLIHIDLPTDIFFTSPKDGDSGSGQQVFIRDAKVELRQPGTVASDSDVGFVPLLSANLEYGITPRWTLLLDLDGLISTQGRAIDAAAKIRYALNDAWYVAAGYRVFEGGVDNDERFAFAWYNFAVVSLGVRF